MRYIGRADYWVFSFEIIFCCFVIYYMVEEVMEIRKVKLDYFDSAWNIMDLIVILISLFNIIIAVYTEVVVTDLLKVNFNTIFSQGVGAFNKQLTNMFSFFPPNFDIIIAPSC